MLEADLNEAQEIATEEVRKEALDVVGPSGTPDNGYKVSFPPGAPSKADFDVSMGTMYVGGLRVAQANAALHYLTQPEWLDRPSEVQPSLHELVYLSLREQEVSAVEDHALREVALGGPDTAQRTRLVQHIERTNVLDSDVTSSQALATATSVWSAFKGLVFDPATMRLDSKGRLKAAWTTNPVLDPCAPAAPQGYLGDENQLLRIQVSATNKIVWGYDNASFLYRATRLGYDASTDTTTLLLASIPVDERHRPRGGQAVEILTAAVGLGDSDYMAAPTGQVTTVAQAYDAQTQTVVVNHNVGAGAAPVFVRVWEEELDITAGAIAIGPSGLTVTLTTVANGPFSVGDYWLVAVRPSTPTKFYPERLVTPQPPDGPRRWACPLAVIGMSSGGPPLILADCRKPFKNLVKLTQSACCGYFFKIYPTDLTLTVSLQELIDTILLSVEPLDAPIVIGFDPGIYELSAPLVLGSSYAGLTLDGGSGGVKLQAKAGTESAFIDGLISLTNVTGVTLRGLEFVLPKVDFAAAGGTLASVDLVKLAAQGGPAFDFQTLRVSMGVRLLSCTSTTIRDCAFTFTIAPVSSEHVLGAGIFAQGTCSGLVVEGNSFDHKNPSYGTNRNLFGFLLMPLTTFVMQATTETVTSGNLLRPVLDQASLKGNTFEGLTAAALMYGDLGAVTIERNRVRLCYAGFWLLSLNTVAGFATESDLAASRLESLSEAPPDSGYPLGALVASWSDPIVQIGGALARAYPAPVGATLAMGTPFMSNFDLSDAGTLHETLRRTEARAGAEAIALVLRVTNNDADTTPAPSTSAASAAALAVWHLRVSPGAHTTDGSAIVSANRFVSNYDFATAVIVAVERCTVTGNVIHNGFGGSSPGYSLVHLRGEWNLGAVGRVAITGNVFQGTSKLPKAASGLESMGGWTLLNHQES